MRALALVNKRNCEFEASERLTLLDYCWSDVTGMRALLARLEVFLCLLCPANFVQRSFTANI
jgi:hypothetical protein